MIYPIVEEKLILFKELEQKIFKYACELGRELTQQILERYGGELIKARDIRTIEIREAGLPGSRQYMKGAAIPEIYVKQKQKKERKPMNSIWMR